MYRTIAPLMLVAIFASTLAAQAPTRGYVPKHRLVERAREQARQDYRRGTVRGNGAEPTVEVNAASDRMGSGVARTAYHPDMPPYHEPMPVDGMEVISGGVLDGGCAGGCGGCASPATCGPSPGFCGPGGCGFPDCGGCPPPPPLCLPRCLTLEAFWGTQGFTGPVNLAGTGSFGFHSGVNVGTQLFQTGFGGQVGVRGVHSNLSGSNISDDERHQLFITAGIYRRSDHGFQFGLAWDHLTEEYYSDSEVAQLRGEFSFVSHCTSELGVFFRSGVEQDMVQEQPEELLSTEPTDLYAVFYRHRFLPCGAGEGRLYAGFSEDGDGLLGGDFRMPLTANLSLDGGWTYLIPEEATGQGGALNESWNIFLGMAWQPARTRGARNYYRPLFRVADNGSFLRDLN